MRGIFSQMHKIKSPHKNIRRLQKDRNISVFFFVLCLYRVIKERENEHKNMRNTYHNISSLRVSLCFTYLKLSLIHLFTLKS